MKLRWSKAAITDLADVYNYIEKERPTRALRVAMVILEQVESLQANPLRGRAGRVEGTHELVIGQYPYIIPYRIHGDEIHLLRVMHDRRNWPAES